MKRRLGRYGRTAALLVAGILMGATLLAPAGAHVTKSFSHLWNKHIRPKAVDLAYTRTKADKRFVGVLWIVFDENQAIVDSAASTRSPAGGSTTSTSVGESGTAASWRRSARPLTPPATTGSLARQVLLHYPGARIS